MIHPQHIGPIEAAQRAAHAECRRRLMGGKMPTVEPTPPAEPVIVVARIIERPKPIPMPLWKRGDIEFTAHIDAWHAHIRDRHSVRKYLMQRCAEMCVPYNAIVSPLRGSKATSDLRARLMWEVRSNFEGVTYPQMGRIFGRDHTSCIVAVQKVQKELESARS
jgi:hypothetical protein